MRDIRYIVLHCTATPQHTSIASIKNYWTNFLGWNNPGYHFIIEPNGAVTELLPIQEVANGVRGYNQQSIHISYIGGIDPEGAPKDTRTLAQCISMARLVAQYQKTFPKAKVQGHRDFKGVNKACPSFDVAKWLATWMYCNEN